MVVALIQAVWFTHPQSDDATVLQFATNLRPYFLDGGRGQFFVEVQMDDPRIRSLHQFAISQDAHRPLVRFTDVSACGVSPTLRFELTWFAENWFCLEDFAVIGTTINHGFAAFVWFAAGQSFRDHDPLPGVVVFFCYGSIQRSILCGGRRVVPYYLLW
jgi:hypothetical protein